MVNLSRSRTSSPTILLLKSTTRSRKSLDLIEELSETPGMEGRLGTERTQKQKEVNHMNNKDNKNTARDQQMVDEVNQIMANHRREQNALFAAELRRKLEKRQKND